MSPSRVHFRQPRAKRQSRKVWLSTVVISPAPFSCHHPHHPKSDFCDESKAAQERCISKGDDDDDDDDDDGIETHCLRTHNFLGEYLIGAHNFLKEFNKKP